MKNKMSKYLEFREKTYRDFDVLEEKRGSIQIIGKVHRAITEYIFEPTELPLFLNSNSLKEIANFLDKLNKEHLKTNKKGK